MPIPVILGAAAIISGVAGIGSGIHGAAKMKDANDTMKMARSIQQDALDKLESKNTSCTNLLDKVGKRELEVLQSFKEFSDLIENIQGRPKFKKVKYEGVDIPEYEGEKLREVSTGAGLLLGGIGGAAAGTAGGFAAAGATTSAVMAFGTASTGTAISTLSGAAATNATLAALGGGAIGSSATAGGMALGSAVLSGATLGVGLLVGGIIFNVTGSKLSDKADEAFSQAKKTEKEVNTICTYLNKLTKYAREFYKSFTLVESSYRSHMAKLENIIVCDKKTKWSDFSDDEKLITQNTVLLVGMLYKMTQVQLVLQDEDGDGHNTVNVKDIKDINMEADTFMEQIDDSVA